jgi:hypothetical protein
MMPALLGGVFIGVLSGLPIIGICNCCCLWIVSGGVLAAYLEQQNQPVSLRLAQGARVGVIAGIIGAVIWLLLDTALAPIQARFIGEFARTARDLPPELQEMLESIEGGKGPGVIYGFLLLCLSAVVAMIGGMIGAAYFKKDVPPALGGPINPPPIP